MFLRAYCCVMFSYYPNWALCCDAQPYYSLNHICIYTILYYLWSISIAKDRRCCRGVKPETLVELAKYIYIYIFFLRKNFTKQCFGLPQEWSLIYAPSTAMILETLGIIVLNIVNFKTFCDVRCTNELIDLW